MSDMDDLMERCLNKSPRECELEARCAELAKAVDQISDERDRLQVENERLRQRFADMEKETVYLRGIKETVEVLFGRTF